MTHFVPCHKEITTEDIVYLFIDNCYRLHGVPKVIVSDKDPRFIGEFWRSLVRKLNTNLNTSTARHPQILSLTERVDEAMQILLRYHTYESRFDWVSHLPMIERKKERNPLQRRHVEAINSSCGVYNPKAGGLRINSSNTSS
jgi:hypothetical protein